jgi:hypothetical protein
VEARARSFIGAGGAWRAVHARQAATWRPGHGRPGRNRDWAQMGLAWVGSGSAAGPGGDAVGRWVGPSGSAQIDRIEFVFLLFFRNYFSMRKQFQ